MPKNLLRGAEKLEPISQDTLKKTSAIVMGAAKKRKAHTDLSADGNQKIQSSNTSTHLTGKGEPELKTAKKRKTKTKEESSMALATRTVGSKILVGAHVSSAGGVHNAIINSVHIGANALALFLKSQRKWANPPLQPDHSTLFHANCKSHSYSAAKQIVPHGSYLVNLAHTDPARATQAYESFLDDLSRCKSLGIGLYNFHPGNCASSTREEAVKHIAKQLNRAHKDPSSGNVITLLETMATAGNTIGSTFSELASIIDLIEDKSRVGICLDTCHVFAAGYDLRTPTVFQSTLSEFDDTIGLHYLKAVHMNDSKAPLSSWRDLHANIGTGFLGLRAFHNLVNEPRLWGVPLVLETPIDIKGPDGKTTEDRSIWAREIKLLESLVGMDIEGEEFKELEKDLQKQGETERARVQDQVDRKKGKDDKPKRQRVKEVKERRKESKTVTTKPQHD